MAESTRCEPRVKMVVPVTLWIQDGFARSHFMAHTLDVSPQGARLGGIHCSVTVGMDVEVQRLNRRAKFRVVWCNNPSKLSRETQVGLACLESTKDIWAADFSRG